MLSLLASISLAGPASPPLDDARLAAIVAPIRAKAGVPALAVAVVVDGKTVALAADGFRKWGDKTRVAKTDRFHIGSITKSMTATLIALLVKDGKLKWESTPADLFPELRDTMDPGFRRVTLMHLLSHRAGIPTSYAPASWSALGDAFKDQRAARYRYVAELLRKKPQSEPGERYEYTNAGYILAGAMAEKATGQGWETLMRRRVFEPLKMTTAGFGPMGTPGKLDQPWQHRWAGDKPVPCPNVPAMDNPPALGPAGRVHCSIGDLAKYATAHLTGESGKTGLLDPAAFRYLHTPPFGGEYALGWLVLDRPWANGRAVFHNGSNNMNYAVVWMAPSRRFAVVIACNSAGPKAEKAVDDVAAACIRACIGD